MLWLALVALCVGALPAKAQQAATGIDEVVLIANADTTLKIGDVVTVDVVYNGVVTPTGTPTLNVLIGTKARQARCGTSGTTKLRCQYTVVEGDESDGALAPDDLGVTGATARTDDGVIENGAGLPDTDFTTAQTTVPANVSIDGVRVGISLLAVTGEVITTTNRTAYKQGDTVRLQVTFDDTITSVRLGNFGVTLDLDGDDRAMTRTSVNAGDNTVVYSYVVAAGDSTKRIVVRYTGTDTLMDSAGNAGLSSGAATVATAVNSTFTVIDTTPPRMLSVSVASDNTSDSPHQAGAMLALEVEFSEDVTVTGVPQLEVVVGSVTGAAPCNQTGLTPPINRMTCTLDVAQGWSDPNGISIPRNPLRLGGTEQIEDRQEHAVDFTFAGMQLPDEKVDAIAPWIRTLTLSPPSSSAIKVNAQVTLEVTFSEEVVLTDPATPHTVPTFTIAHDGVVVGDPRMPTFVGGTATKWQYRYSLTPDDIGTDSAASLTFAIADPAPASVLTLTEIEDLAGNDLSAQIDTTLPISVLRNNIPSTGPADNRMVNVGDTTQPTAQSVRIDHDKSAFMAGETIRFAVLFSEPINAPENITLAISVGGQAKTATLADTPRQRGNYEAVFEYEVQGGDSGRIGVSGLRFGATTGSFGDLKDLATPANGYEGGSRPDNYYEAIPSGQDGHVPDRTDAECQSVRSGCRKSSTYGEITYGQTARSSGPLSGSYSVDTTRPTVTRAELLRTPAPGAESEQGKRFYGLGDYIRAQLTISEAVMLPAGQMEDTVTLSTNIGGPNSQTIGCAAMTLQHISSSGRALTFECRVKSGDRQLGGLELRDLVVDTSGTDEMPSDAAGNFLSGTSLLGPQSTHLVDGSLSGSQEGVAPIADTPTETTPQPVNAIRSVIDRSDTSDTGFLDDGDDIIVEVNFDPPVSFTTAPQLLLDFDEGGDRGRVNADRTSGQDVTRLTFRYTVEEGDEARDGVGASLIASFTDR